MNPDTLHALLEHAKGFMVVPTIMVLVYFHWLVLPLLKEARALGVLGIMFARAAAKKFGLDLEAERAEAEKAIPDVQSPPNLSNGLGAIVSIATKGTKS